MVNKKNNKNNQSAAAARPGVKNKVATHHPASRDVDRGKKNEHRNDLLANEKEPKSTTKCKESSQNQLIEQCKLVEDFPKPPEPVQLEQWWDEMMAIYFPASFICTLVILGTNVAIYFFTPFLKKNASIVPWWLQVAFAIFFQVQIVANVFALQTQSYKDCPTYQMNRLGISAKKMALKSTRVATLYGGTKIYREWKFCDICKRIVPLRSVHCDVCGRCSLRNDHHCYVVGSCVGVQTLRYFITMMFYFWLLGILGASVGVRYHWGDLWTITPSWPNIVSAKKLIVQYIWSLWEKPLVTSEKFVWWILNCERPLYLTMMCTVIAMLSLAAGISFTKQSIRHIYKGFAQKEAQYLWYVAIGDSETTTFMERVRFIFGSSFPLGLLWPRTWEEVEWNEKFKDSVILNPLMADDDSEEIEEGETRKDGLWTKIEPLIC